MQIHPEAIIAERDRTLNRMVEYFLGREGTKALFVSGSVAAEESDAYSDIDFGIAAAHEVFRRARQGELVYA